MMDEHRLRKLLREVRERSLPVEEAERRLKDLPFAELGYATLDTHRALRFGFPEVVYGEGKTTEQLLGIVKELNRRGQPVLVTRLSAEKAGQMLQRFPNARYSDPARIFHLAPEKTSKRRPRGTVAVVTAGTSDAAIAEEAALTAEAMGVKVVRVYDVGVAGIHRLLRKREEIQRANAAVVVAGMEGALASAVGGLVGIPVVGVPTSIGYGANFRGLSAMLSMLNSCAPNVATVNIDNGFGGGFYAALIALRAGRPR